MRVLLTGGSGQLGTELQKSAPAGCEIVAPARAELNLGDLASVRSVARDAAPTHIIHAGAWTAVDAAEASPEDAHTVNAESTAVLAEIANELNAHLLYVSTDFVFGEGHDRPISPQTSGNPLSVYGATKYAGERAVRHALGDKGTIVRTSWVYAAHGANFVRTMIRLMAERDNLSVVDDQISAPTSAANLAAFCWQLVSEARGGLWHFSDAGAASWYDFACAIYAEGRARGLLTHDVHIQPIPTEAYPTPATRPRYSLLDKRTAWGVSHNAPKHWRVALCSVLDELAAQKRKDA